MKTYAEISEKALDILRANHPESIINCFNDDLEIIKSPFTLAELENEFFSIISRLQKLYNK